MTFDVDSQKISIVFVSVSFDIGSVVVEFDLMPQPNMEDIVYNIQQYTESSGELMGYSLMPGTSTFTMHSKSLGILIK